MAKYFVTATATVEIEVEVEAETIEEALELAEDNVRLTEYSGGQVGIEVYDDEHIDIIDLVDNDWIEWNGAYCREIED